MKNLLTITALLALASTATADDKKPVDAKKAPEAPKMEAPKPSQELTDMGKNMVGNWKCTGKAMGMDFKGMTIKSTLDMEKFWIKSEMAGSIGPIKVKTIEYITFDAGQKKWFRLAVDNHGGHEKNWSADGKVWEGEMTMMGQTTKSKATMEWVTPAKEWKIGAQMSADGKKWETGFEMNCKK